MLTDEDREALISLLIDEYGGERADWVELGSLRRLSAAIGAIVARRVKAALNEVADQVEPLANEALTRKPEPCGHEDGFCHSSAAFAAFDHAARIVRSHADASP